MNRITHSHACRTVATAAVLLLGVALLPAIASAAGIGGRALGAESVTAGTWGATASTTSMAFNSNSDQTSTVTNSGTLALSAESYVVTVSRPIIGVPRVTVFECATPWVGNRCSGGAGTQIGGTLAADSTTTITSTTPLAVGGALYLQVEMTGVIFFTTTVTIAPEVTSPAQVRTAVSSNQ